MAEIDIKLDFVFSLLLILIVSSFSSSSSDWVDFDIYELAIQWDPATCSDRALTQRCSILPHDKFSIRGLWPTKYPFNIVGPCNGSAFNPQIIRPIEFDLNRNWPNLFSGNNLQVWEEAWRNHGSCTEARLDQLQYFTFALNSFIRHDLLAILANSNIRPDRRSYFRENVERALVRAIGVRPGLFCNFNRLSNSRQLQQIRLCFNRDTRAPINCWTTIGNCSHSFDWFPYMRTFYTHFQVALQWQPANCFNSVSQARCRQAPELKFSINGVWPTTATNVILGPCSGSNFDATQISPIRTRLDRAWPDLINARNERLWGIEWSNRGTCSEDQFGQLQYFSFGLHVYETHDILGMLRRNNVTPNGESYRRENVENALIRSAGRRPHLVCNLWRINTTTFTQLHQIIWCYDDYGREFQDCQGTPVGMRPCPAEFSWFP